MIRLFLLFMILAPYHHNLFCLRFHYTPLIYKQQYKFVKKMYFIRKISIFLTLKRKRKFMLY